MTRDIVVRRCFHYTGFLHTFYFFTNGRSRLDNYVVFDVVVIWYLFVALELEKGSGVENEKSGRKRRPGTQLKR